KRGLAYTFNHHAMRAVNADLQMRSDWYLPLCTGKERLKINGTKAHATQKPESLLYRVILSSTQPEDIVLDPFFGTGTTGAVAQKLHRRWIGIELDPAYVEMARERINSQPANGVPEAVFNLAEKRSEPRLSVGVLLENGLLQPGQTLYFGERGDLTATVLSNGHIRHKDMVGSIHQVGKALQNAPCNGWEHWYYVDDSTGERVVIDHLRQKAKEANGL
ncbi:MAG: site-specific DNA-methyltransferase, partial [Chloroflexota bacterium]